MLASIKALWKRWKMLFCFMLKVLFGLEKFTFLSWFYCYVENSLVKKLRLISKFMGSQIGQQIITIHILLNISRSWGNQKIKFVQLMEYKMSNSFLGNNTRNFTEKVVPEHFIENQNWTYLWTNSFKYYKVCFYCMLRSAKIYSN